MGYVKQRADLLADNLAIPLFDNWDDATTDQNSFKHVTLDYWLPSYGQDDDGHVFTPLGIFLSIDLDYRDEIPNDDRRIVLVPNTQDILADLDTAFDMDFSPLVRTLKQFGIEWCMDTVKTFIPSKTADTINMNRAFGCVIPATILEWRKAKMNNESLLNATIVALEMRERQLQALQPSMATALYWTQQALAEMRSFQRGDQMASIWTVDDVYGLVEGDGDDEPSVKITEAEARAVLQNVESNHDAEQGINWDTLRYALEDVLSERGEDPNGGDGQDD